jgi:CheY-like chemotaxis protein
MKILIVDDNSKIIKMIQRRLKKTGHEIHTAENGKIGMEKALGIKPDLILMDMHMPVVDGYKATRTLRKQGYTGKIAAFAASASAEDVPKAVAAGCDYFIPKPIGTDFEAKIAEIMAAPQMGRLTG